MNHAGILRISGAKFMNQNPIWPYATKLNLPFLRSQEHTMMQSSQYKCEWPEERFLIFFRMWKLNEGFKHSDCPIKLLKIKMAQLLLLSSLGKKHTYVNIYFTCCQIFLCLTSVSNFQLGSQNTIKLVQELHGPMHAWQLGCYSKSSTYLCVYTDKIFLCLSAQMSKFNG